VQDEILLLGKSPILFYFGNERSEIPETLWPVTRFLEVAKPIAETVSPIFQDYRKLKNMSMPGLELNQVPALASKSSNEDRRL
jgi:hypothetical protein